MNIKLEPLVDSYFTKVESLLLRKEANNNLMLGLLNRAKQHPFAFPNGLHLGLIEEDGKVVYAFMQTPPNHWILADVEKCKQVWGKEIAQYLNSHSYDVPSIIGPLQATKSFIQEWERLTDKKGSVDMEQLIYQLNSVKITPAANGELVQATKDRHELITNWLYQFGQEAGMNITSERAEEMALSYVTNQSLYFWEVRGEPVSMVNNSRRTKHGVTINAVFTPDEHKRNGYASSAVAALSQKLLDEGFSFCSLYTDASNPTSNSIYKRIGYDEVGESIVYQLET